MKTRALSVVCAICAAWPILTNAQDEEAEEKPTARSCRIDIDGRELVPLNPREITAGTITNASWMEDDEKDYYLTIQCPSSTFEWQRIEFSFMPMADGEITICLKGQWKRVDDKQVQLWCLYDSILMKGGKIRNGDFEETKDDGTPLGWKTSTSADTPGEHINDVTTSYKGNRCAKVWHDGSMSQRVAVRGGREVRIRIWHQSIEE